MAAGELPLTERPGDASYRNQQHMWWRCDHCQRGAGAAPGDNQVRLSLAPHGVTINVKPWVEPLAVA